MQSRNEPGRLRTTLESVERHVFLSPHPDDAVWSCGGQMAALAEARCDVVILCFFTGDPDTRAGNPYSAAWRGAFRPSMRRTEELVAARILGARVQFLGFIEAAFRMTDGAPRYGGPSELLGPVAPDDAPLVDDLSAALLAQLCEGDRLYVPRAASSHVDHVLVRRAAERCVAGFAACYYDEFPYPSRAVEPSLARSVVAVPLDLWLHAALRYRSQVMSLFGSPGRFQEALTSWARDRGREIGQEAGLCLWLPRAAK